MTSELPGDEGRLPKWVPLRGPLLGIFVLSLVLLVIIHGFRAEFTNETFFIYIQALIILSIIIGGGIGGLIQLTRQGRTADIPRFFRVLCLFALRYFLMFTLPLCVLVWLAHRFDGPWRWVIYVGGCVLGGLLPVLYDRWSSRKKPSTSPPA